MTRISDTLNISKQDNLYINYILKARNSTKITLSFSQYLILLHNLASHSHTKTSSQDLGCFILCPFLPCVSVNVPFLNNAKELDRVKQNVPERGVLHVHVNFISLLSF
ncbi:unnamed protein product [Chrysodeixis includens]|uniref:Uncharacterized protein n=1 Tax=Chrysodeixis includens TaxID=689277 RepID=A0A9N8L175_CHRIL|nr:unnamed protein product [Chrysodeixis includens]